MRPGGTVPAETWEGAPVEAWRTRWRLPELHVFRQVGSTNDVLRRRAEAGAPAGAVALAEEQTAGRGRAGRRWHAPPGAALLLSILLRPPPHLDADAAPGVAPLRVGLAVARAIERVAAVRAGIKWPNDIVLENGRKLAGILCEGTLATTTAGYLVAGIGVNVAHRPDAWPPDVRARAASLQHAAGRPIPRAELAGAIIDEVRRVAEVATAPLPDPLARELAARDVLHGRHITVDGTSRGVARGIARDGALIVHADAGISYVHSGSVRLADPAPPETRSVRA